MGTISIIVIRDSFDSFRLSNRGRSISAPILFIVVKISGVDIGRIDCTKSLKFFYSSFLVWWICCGAHYYSSYLTNIFLINKLTIICTR